MKSIYFVFVLVMINLSTFSQNYNKFGMETVAEGLSVGTIAPDFEGVNQKGEKILLKRQLEKGVVVLIFYRGYWCPHCSKHLKLFQDSLQVLVENGAQIIAITPEQEDGVNNTIDNTKAQFDIISDIGNRIQKDYKVLFEVTDKYKMKIKTWLFTDIADNNGDTVAYLPVPATYIIGQDNKIKYVQFDPNYKNRSNVKEILQNL